MINNPILMDSGVYVWEKYNAVVTTYSENQGTIDDGFEEKPSDLDSSAKYLQYSFDSTTGIFTLSLTDPGGKYYATNSPQKIYHYSSYLITGGGTEQRKNLYVPYTAVPDGYQKGSTYYGTMTSEDEATYPANGEQDGYWYVLVGKTGAEGGGNSPVLQAKSVTPSESSQNVTPDAGYDGLSKVTVSAIQTETKTVTSNGTVTPSAGKYLKQVTVNVPTSSSPNLQTKSVSPSESEQSVTPDTGYDGLSRVTVGAIQTETKTVTANGTVTPSSGKYLKQVTVNVPTSGLDTSDATATARDISENKTAYVNGEKVTGSLPPVNNLNFNAIDASWDSQNSELMLSGKNLFRCIFSESGTSTMSCTGDKLGDATAADVAQGKTFTSAAGLKVTGTHVCSGGGTTPMLQSKTVSPSTSQQTVTPDSGYDGLSRVTVNGDVNLVAENIKSGVSIFGVAGNFEGSSGSGGSSDNNCEAYHITSTSATLNFKTTGTVKVWGYGAKKSNYTTTLYAFVGDGYYAGSSYGTPSKTSATFSIASNGTLSGLPSDLTAVDLLVTIGV